MDERNVSQGACARQYTRGLGIGTEGRIDIVLGLVHRRVGRGIDHDGRRHALDQRRKSVGAIEIGHFATRTVGQLAGARGNDHVAQRTQTSPQLMPDLAVAAEQQDGHGV